MQGMPQGDFEFGLRLLLQHTPRGTERAVYNRFTAEFLPELPTARSSLDHSNGSGKALPGVGHEFWQYSRAHIYCGTLPPQMPRSITSFATNISASQVHMVMQFLQKAIGRTQLLHIQWDQAQTLPLTCGTVIRIPMCDVFQRYQNNKEVKSFPVIKYHGTRLINVQGIATLGLASSDISHRVRGLWLNDDIEAALHWNKSVLDRIPGIAIEVAANPEHVRQNRLIKGTGEGRETRFCLELQPGETLPEAQLVALLVAVPSVARIGWVEQCFHICKETFQYLLTLPLEHTCVTFDLTCKAAELHSLIAFRLAYRSEPTAMARDFGAFTDQMWTASGEISLAVTQLLSILLLDSVNHRTRDLPKFCMRFLPYPFRAFVTAKWPELHHWANWMDIDDRKMVMWTIGPMQFHLQRWLPMNVSDTSHLI